MPSFREASICKVEVVNGGETVGLITYMRTDGVQMAREAIFAIRDHVKGAFGDDYIPGAPREYTSKAKNAQEAHEAIRPTDVTRTPESVARFLDDRQRRLYELIWKRAVASQMQSAELDQTTVEIADASGRTKLRATGSVIAFDGFLRLYHEDEDEREADARAGIAAQAEDEDTRTLPPMREKDPLKTGAVAAVQHFTQPPPRYSEASLVKRLEELGIGRPSTYASILQVLQDRMYVRLEKRRFIPEDRGRLVTAFLVSFFQKYVDTGFTAGLEEKLDDISGGRADWRQVMRDFWKDFSAAIAATTDLKISDVIDALDEDLGPHFFPEREGAGDPRACPSCGNGRLGLRLGRTGAFIGCSNYPECRYTRPLIAPGADGEVNGSEGPRELGVDPAGQRVTLRRGPYGLYVQLGEETEDAKGKKVKPRRASLTRDMNPDTLDLEAALGLLSLPRVVGRDPETGEEITAGIGRFGPYVRLGNVYQSLEPGDDVLVLGHEPRDGASGQGAREGAAGGHAPEGQRRGGNPQGALRAVRDARQDGGEFAPRDGDGKCHAGRGGDAAGGEGEGTAAPRRGRWSQS
jgi:DNA topoisomerase-1